MTAKRVNDETNQLNHPDFVRALKQGDERAFDRLVRLYQDRVHNVCFRLLGDHGEAEDVAQDVFVTLYKKIGSFREASRLTTWIYRIATNQALNRLKYLARRHHQRSRSLDVLEFERPRRLSTFPRPDQVLDASRLETYLQEALERLDPDQRAVIILRDIEGLSYEEVAQITQLNLGTLKSRLHRGRARLKSALDAWFKVDVPHTGETPNPQRKSS